MTHVIMAAWQDKAARSLYDKGFDFCFAVDESFHFKNRRDRSRHSVYLLSPQFGLKRPFSHVLDP